MKELEITQIRDWSDGRLLIIEVGNQGLIAPFFGSPPNEPFDKSLELQWTGTKRELENLSAHSFDLRRLGINGVPPS